MIYSFWSRKYPIQVLIGIIAYLAKRSSFWLKSCNFNEVALVYSFLCGSLKLEMFKFSFFLGIFSYLGTKRSFWVEIENFRSLLTMFIRLSSTCAICSQYNDFWKVLRFWQQYSCFRPQRGLYWVKNLQILNLRYFVVSSRLKSC